MPPGQPGTELRVKTPAADDYAATLTLTKDGLRPQRASTFCDSDVSGREAVG
jgi:hypothetical protein